MATQIKKYNVAGTYKWTCPPDVSQIKVDETKGEITTEKKEVLDTLNDVIIEKAVKGYSLYKDYSKSTDGKLKRLIR